MIIDMTTDPANPRYDDFIAAGWSHSQAAELDAIARTLEEQGEQSGFGALE